MVQLQTPLSNSPPCPGPRILQLGSHLCPCAVPSRPRPRMPVPKLRKATLAPHTKAPALCLQSAPPSPGTPTLHTPSSSRELLQGIRPALCPVASGESPEGSPYQPEPFLKRTDWRFRSWAACTVGSLQAEPSEPVSGTVKGTSWHAGQRRGALPAGRFWDPQIHPTLPTVSDLTQALASHWGDPRSPGCHRMSVKVQLYKHTVRAQHPAQPWQVCVLWKVLSAGC